MQAMILAAGRGTRLGELGRRVPKALVEIDGRPLLARQLDYLAGHGVERAVVNAHHLSEQIIAFVAAHAADFPVEVSEEEELLGTAGGVRRALDRFDRSQPIVVLYADTLLDAPLAQIVEEHRHTEAEATLCVNWLASTQGKGLVSADGDGTILGFEEKPADGPPGLASAGLYVVEPGLVELAPPHGFYDFGLDLFPRALAAGRRLRAHVLDRVAHDIGTPAALAQARGLTEVSR